MFGLPLLQKAILLGADGVRVGRSGGAGMPSSLIIAPTREVSAFTGWCGCLQCLISLCSCDVEVSLYLSTDVFIDGSSNLLEVNSILIGDVDQYYLDTAAATYI